MFKLESYITPVILSYVEKYVKNFKPEQSQVSLWGGDASFQNLDLRLEVLEEQLNLPFSLVSGHIHELLIHVPWVKITSEPIVVTINTIECILKLKDDSHSDNSSSSYQKRQSEIVQEETPPGYIKSIVTKVINNITIICNNLILKYVEEDIVLSINVRHLSMQTVNNKWEPAFADVSSYEVMLQKLITIQDLTLCLDKMDTSGKIEIYQDPVLYRCSMVIRMIMNYHSNTSKRASVTRLDLHCEKMEFSTTEQQVPMLLRLTALLMALRTKQFPEKKDKSSNSADDKDSNSQEDSNSGSGASTEVVGWGGWAWNTMSSIFPVAWDNDWSNDHELAFAGHTVHLGIYIDDATLTFKVTESIKEQLFYKPRKIKYKSFLSLRFTGAVVDALFQGMSMTNFQMGFGSINVYPRGSCSCGHPEVIDGVRPPLYLMVGKATIDHLKDTLFDDEAVENKGKKRIYKQGIENHLSSHPVEKLLERCPAFMIDYAHHMVLSEDVTPEDLLEFGANFEYSNFPEHRVVRFAIGDLMIRLSSGVFHRADTIIQAASKYDYAPYIVPKPDPTIDELPPVTVEEYEALRENISKMEIKLFMIRGAIQLQLADHRITGLQRQRKYVESRTEPLTPALSDDPYTTIEWDEILIEVEEPIYPFRLAACASKQTDLPQDMFNQCHREVKGLMQGLNFQLYLKPTCHTSIIMPCTVNFSMTILLYRQYWTSLDVIHNFYSFEIDGITITGTKSKIMVASSIISSVFQPNDTTNALVCSSLFDDACDEKKPTYLELCLENINLRNIKSLAVQSTIVNVGSIKIFAHNETDQAFILSGPEVEDQRTMECNSLLSAVIQYSKDSKNQRFPTVMSFQVGPVKGCLDPLLLQWLEYRVKYYKLDTLYSAKPETRQQTSEPSSNTESKKRKFPSLHESVHSSSDKEKRKHDDVTEKSPTIYKINETEKNQPSNESMKQENLEKPKLLERLIELYPWWHGLVLSGYVGHITIYIPTNTMSGIDANGIEEAKDRAIRNNENLQVLVVKMPMLLINSAGAQADLLKQHLEILPIILPKSLWTNNHQSFPWKLEILDFQCYTLKQGDRKNFIKQVSFNATIALATKLNSSELNSKLSSMQLSIYVDTSPIIISASEEQIIFLRDIISKITRTLQNIVEMKKNIYTSSSLVKNDQESLLIMPSPTSPSQFAYPEDTTTTSTVSVSKDNLNQEKSGLTLSAWVQWTITKVIVKFYTSQQSDSALLKLVLELEDIITSADIQPVYFKLVHKITTATIFHYSRAPNNRNWDFGEYVGLLMCGREDNFEKGEDTGFLNFTLTKAKLGNVHTRWGANRQYKSHKKDFRAEEMKLSGSYITEVDVKIQMLDLILPPSVVGKFVQLVKPFLNFHDNIPKNSSLQESAFIPPFIGITKLRNETLPLVYLDFKGIRLMLPVSTTILQGLQHDLLMFQLDGIKISPRAENPICRIPLRMDVYQLAAQANILNIPGSAVEDRQYQINVNGISTYTTTWKNYQQSITKRMSQSYLYTMHENPAVEWNKLGNGSSLELHFSTFPIITRFDLCIIIAPTIIFQPKIIVCGSAAEINCLTDIEVTMNLHQIRLISALHAEFNNLFSDLRVPNTSTEIAKSCSTNAKSSPLKTNIANESEVELSFDFETASMNSMNIEKPLTQGAVTLPPFEFLVNCGKITFICYELQKSLDNLYSTEDEDIFEDDNSQYKQLLFYFMIDQPNLYISQQHLTQKIQFSCFDMAISLGNEERQDYTSMPTSEDFKVFIIQVKSGERHPDTGIPPSFITIKCETLPGKSPQFFLDMGRPTKMYFSLERQKKVNSILEKVKACFVENESITKLSTKSSSDLTNIHQESSPRSIKYTIPDFNLITKQIVFSFTSESGAEIIISLASLAGSVLNVIRPERIYGNVTLDSFVISGSFRDNMKVFLNPWCCNVTICLLWESWQDVNSFPQIQIQADSDSIHLNCGPQHLQIIKTVLFDLQEFFSRNTRQSSDNKTQPKQSSTITEQHYKDDLKSGVFQFVDGTADDLPLPYQVVFFTFPQQAMAWRYPHPRALTRIHVSPVPFEAWSEDDTEDRIHCVIEYWSDSQGAYKKYVEFYLSETDSYRLDLPDKTPARAVASVWRIVLGASNPTLSKTLVPTRALIACLRIDSYFNSLIIPNIQAALNVSSINLALYNYISPNAYENLPPPLTEYTLNGMIPEMQCFMCVEHKEAVFIFNKWLDGSALIDISGILRVHILDYGLLILQEVIDNMYEKLQISISEKTDVSMTCSPFSLKLSPAISHTLAVSANLWSIALDDETKPAIIITRFIIANDCNIPIRFGQNGTDDNILLKSRECYFYSWRHANNQSLRISLEDNAWIWSKPFAVSRDGVQNVDFGNSSDILITITVSSISATQKLVTFSGQFIISNQLTDNFQMKLVKYELQSKEKSGQFQDLYFVPGRSQPSSIVLGDNSNMTMRLRFSSIPNLSWTGDIPLQPNTKWGQPWLVKVPLQERGQFISIWVRIVKEEDRGKSKILAVLSPLYMIRSYLPVPAKVQIETPSLKGLIHTTVMGRGEKQQLYCPGTFEHFHQLTFQLESGVSASNPYVPLSYSSVDQRVFFKRPEKENIQEILKALESSKNELQWPFQTDEIFEWIAAEQPQTHVQVKYQDAGLVSSTLLLELQPWCFLLNSSGCHISLVAEDIELCSVPHFGIVAPPKLEGTFNLGVAIGDTYYTSSALQLSRPDWSQSFYMPKIGGLIPLEGNMKTHVDCGSSVCILNIKSAMLEEMRFVRICSSFVIGNMTSQELCVATLAVSEDLTDFQLPDDLTPFSINILPTEDQKQAVSITQWHSIDSSNFDSVALYVSFSLGHQWSCPVRVDQSINRKSIAVPNDYSTVPVVVTTQEDKGTMYILIHPDEHPQLMIDNSCFFKIFIGEANETTDGIVQDTQHFSWMCKIESGTLCHYTVPTVASRMPDSSPTNVSSILVFSTPPTEDDDFREKDNKTLRWSRGIVLSPSINGTSEQFVRLPYYGDVKVIMQTRCYTTYLHIGPISQVEVSARDIRSKLCKTTNYKLQETEVIYNRMLSIREEEKDLDNVQNSESSTSVTSFFSAEDDNLGLSLKNPKEMNVNLKPIVKNRPSYDNLKSLEKSNESSKPNGFAIIHFQGITLIVMHDINENGQRTEVASLSLNDTILSIDSRDNLMDANIYIGDLQFDNQIFEQGGYDFPVVLISQKTPTKKEKTFYFSNCLKSNLQHITEGSLVTIILNFEFDGGKRACKEFRAKLAPISAYIEDTYVSQLLDYAAALMPPCFINSDGGKKIHELTGASNVYIPDYIMIDAKILSSPLRLQTFTIEPLSILLSVHTSVHLYVALDHSPLYFNVFEKKNFLTTPYRLGNALTMHYLSGAIFGAGWVVGSLEILGSPGGLAQALGSGLKDFIALPFQGLLQGPWGFIVGITHGSASLMRHITAGTVNSVTKLASSVARNLDRLTLDEEHLQRQEEARRVRPQGMAQGLYQGLTGFGMSLLAAVAGLAHHPLQQVWSGESTTMGLVTGVGLGLVGVVTKPLSGAAELVARTGQGLLQGAGWNSLPSPRQRPIVQYSTPGCNAASLRYVWRLMPLLAKSGDSILHVASADHVVHQGSNRAVILVLTRQALLLVNVDEDSVEKIFSLKELIGADHPSDSTMLRLFCPSPVTHPARNISPMEHTEMNQEMRARVAEFLRTSSTGIASLSTNSDAQSDTHETILPPPESSLTFYVSPDSRNYLLTVFNVAKKQSQGSGFNVL
ncbi:vacuolar protein sorting-associated protein 13B [Leptopilina heterotoma]|uniref:vacuolar protein sorting-associated protein 13B n=1 Tax=Leptopilina heterotoma TaxID=63436 RepID=UPI001CA7D19E|nr:vacuolar protein sorting-associated protein 13B [Leptopilina heterotoma]